MATANLTTTSYLVLGLLAWRGPSTPYELKQTVGGTVGNFWTFPHSQLYSEPARLAEAGLVVEEREERGRRRRVFEVTDAGVEALRSWLADPSPELTEIRDVALLKLFFGGLTDPADVVSLAAAQLRGHAERLAGYEQLDARLADSPAAWGHPRATLRMGLAYERAAVAFWRSVVEQPPAPHRGAGSSR